MTSHEADYAARPSREIQVAAGPGGGRFANIVARLACTVCDTPIAGMTSCLPDQPWTSIIFGRQTKETSSWRRLTAQALKTDEVLTVSDMKLDDRFQDDPFVVEAPHLRFFAAAPLRLGDGRRIGTLHVADRQPRRFTQQNLQNLRDLAGVVSAYMRTMAELARIEEMRRRQDVKPFRERSRAGAEHHMMSPMEDVRVSPRSEPKTADAWQKLGADSSVETIWEGATTASLARWTALDLPRHGARRRSEPMARPGELHDALTGLPNQQSFRKRLYDELCRVSAGRENCAVLRIDLCRFKVLDATLGRDITNVLFQTIAERISIAILPDQHLARCHGDEFAVLVPAATFSIAESLARRLIKVISQPIEIDRMALTIEASIGIAFATGPDDTAEELMSRAGLALSRAQTTGRSEWRLFDATQDWQCLDLLRLEFDLCHALRRQEFSLDYQPSVDPRTGRIIGFEALLRWHHPERGLIPLSTLIPMAEESGLIIPIGEWCLHEACRFAATWPDDLRVAVNVSVAQIRQPNLEMIVVAALAASGIAPHRLELEITETVLIDDVARVLDTLNRLRALGVRIALDDFGTGFSSLGYLHDLHLDKIKVDRVFIRRLREPATATIVKAVMDLGRQCHWTVVAEGVETMDEYDVAKDMGFDEIQGFFYSAPVRNDQVLDLLQSFDHAR